MMGAFSFRLIFNEKIFQQKKKLRIIIQKSNLQKNMKEIIELIKLNPIFYFRLSEQDKIKQEICQATINHPRFKKVWFTNLPEQIKSEQYVFDIIFEKKLYELFVHMDEELIVRNLDKISRVYNQLPQEMKFRKDLIHTIIGNNDYYNMFNVILNNIKIDISKETCIKIFESLIERDHPDFYSSNQYFSTFINMIDTNIINDKHVVLSFIKLNIHYKHRLNVDFDAIPKDKLIFYLDNGVIFNNIWERNFRNDPEIIFHQLLNDYKLKYALDSMHEDNQIIAKGILFGSNFNLEDLKRYSLKLYKNRKFLCKTIPKFLMLNDVVSHKIVDFTFYIKNKINSFHNMLIFL